MSSDRGLKTFSEKIKSLGEYLSEQLLVMKIFGDIQESVKNNLK